MVENFGLLNDLFPFPSILDAGYPVLISIWQISCLMLSSHLYVGLPCDLLVRGFHLNILLTVLVSGILCTWPNQLSLWALIWLTIFLCFINLSSSSLVWILHIFLLWAQIMILNYVPQNHAVYIVSPSLLNILSPIVNLLANLYSEMDAFTFRTLWWQQIAAPPS